VDAWNERTGNLLLDSVTSDERGELLARADRRPITPGFFRRRPGEAVDAAVFPMTGTYSVIVQPDEVSVEAATVGREGVLDVYATIGSRIASQILLAQVPGEAVEIEVETFLKVYREGPQLPKLVHGYIAALFAQAAMSAACLALHRVEERCARWLLETHDRVDVDTFELKQEFLAVMLAVSRPSVSVAAGTLQRAGLITFSRGSITVLDREGLENAACSCYEAVRSQYSRLVPLQ